MKQLIDLLEFYRSIGVEYIKKLNIQDKREALETLKSKVLSCTKCQLHQTRTNAVFGEGNIDAQIMFVGEAPGRDEDLQGRPFVGRAGRLLNQLLEEVGIKRSDVYIANCLKCRPPGNRDPQPEELSACIDYLKGQISIIKPRVIGTLGRYSTYILTGQRGALGTLRGRTFSYQSIIVMPMYHPAYLLRNPNATEVFLRDLEELKKLSER